MVTLKSISLRGFKSIDGEGQEVRLGQITVLIGANGAGKSNFVSFLRMINFITTQGLQNFVANEGFADSLLYFGRKTTTEMGGCVQFETGAARDEYRFVLQADATNRLFFQDETIEYHAPGHKQPLVCQLGGGSKESQLLVHEGPAAQTCNVVQKLLSGCRVYQFHDTSATAKIRAEGYVDDARYLRSDGGNLAAFLRAMKMRKDGEKYYERIVRHVQQMVPHFEDFELTPLPENVKYVRLNWREKGRDYLFGPHQLSDGSLRFMALSTLFLQPPETRPNVIIVDEPELGLHPSAIVALAGMVKAAAVHTQVVLATQSPRLVDEFSVDDIVVVERDAQKARSVFRRLDARQLQDWLERYCLSELWEKNVLGGQP